MTETTVIRSVLCSAFTRARFCHIFTKRLPIFDTRREHVLPIGREQTRCFFVNAPVRFQGSEQYPERALVTHALELQLQGVIAAHIPFPGSDLLLGNTLLSHSRCVFCARHHLSRVHLFVRTQGFVSPALLLERLNIPGEAVRGSEGDGAVP